MGVRGGRGENVDIYAAASQVVRRYASSVWLCTCRTHTTPHGGCASAAEANARLAKALYCVHAHHPARERRTRAHWRALTHWRARARLLRGKGFGAFLAEVGVPEDILPLVMRPRLRAGKRRRKRALPRLVHRRGAVVRLAHVDKHHEQALALVGAQ